MQIYLLQTINLIGQTYGQEVAQNIVNNCIPKQFEDGNYYFIVNLPEDPDQSPTI